MHSSLRLATIVSILLTIPALAAPRFPIKSFTWENDDIFLPGGVDRYYTNGLRLTYFVDPARDWNGLDNLRVRFCRIPRACDGEMNATMSVLLGHSFYTPQDITQFRPQPRDRPFAGWIYTGAAVQITSAHSDDFTERNVPTRTQHSLETTIGLLGPGAGARFLQTEWHAVPFVNGRPPNGWGNQLRNEPTLQFVYQHSRRYGTPSIDVVPNAGAALGTIQTYATAGFLVRAGRNITGFGIPIVSVSLDGTPTRPPLEYYVFGGADARYVAHNAFLDGGFFRDGPSVPRQNVVTDIRAGVSVRYRSLRLTYSLVERSRELQRAAFFNEGRHRFASVTVAVERPLDFR